MTMPMSDPSVWAQAMSSLGMPPLNMTGQQLMPVPLSKPVSINTEKLYSSQQAAPDASVFKCLELSLLCFYSPRQL
ncbi:hypothetical protein CgunFtcFv8_017388 [Champsocephalus gunnari]|uniref:Uncharacterized protein n=1 Tax=Champsocephalus gunnari TaxID=52237 RepID=A0AAN8DKC2_CHAGU|nr:hypothetical protein CgunFtcFv8_017388 [Champsocephalus gunnari]